MTAPDVLDVGSLLRRWRTLRRLSQLELASRADVSAKHVSFLETGRARPTRDMLLRLGEHLAIPLRERNELLLAGGFAPTFPARELSAAPMAAVSSAIAKILAAQEPNPTLVVDRHWTMIDANPQVAALTTRCAPWLLEPPVNVLRLALHPEGLAPHIVNLAQWRHDLLHRLDHQIEATGDARLRELARELAAYPPGPPDAVPAEPACDGTVELVVGLRVRTDQGELSFLSTTTVFGAARDVTVEDLAIETFFPADAATADVLRSLVAETAPDVDTGVN